MKKGPGDRRNPATTWLSLWLEMKGYTNKHFSRIIMVDKNTISFWVCGRRAIRRYHAQVLRALFPDCPVPWLGGNVPLLSDKMPINARSPEFYRFLFKEMGMVNRIACKETIWPIALEKARMLSVSEASQRPVPPGEPNP